MPWDDPSFMGTCARMSARTRGPALGCPKFHRDVRTWGSSPGCPQCHRDMATCPVTWGGCSPWGQQPHGGWLCHPGQWDRAPNAPKGAPRAVTGSRAEQRKKSKNGEREAGARSPPGPLPVPSLGMTASFPAATASGTSMSMLFNYSAPAWHGAAGSCHRPHRAEGDSAVPSAHGSTGQPCALGDTWLGGDMVGDTWTQVEPPHAESAGLPCSGCSVPQFPHTALNTSVSGEG